MTSTVRVPAGLPPLVASCWRRFYPSYREDAFIDHICDMVRPQMHVLEIGAGSGRGSQVAFPLKGRCRRYVGVDLDPRILDNPHLDEAYLSDAEDLPFPDEQFDLVFHRMVAEHLRDPERAFSESLRVLKPGGRVVFETPCRLYYPMLLAQITPTWIHALLVARLGSGRVGVDVFPTFYRVNTAGRIKRCANRIGATVEITRIATPPGYLRRSFPLFLVGVLYERTVERIFPSLRAGLWATITKPGQYQDRRH